MRSIRTKADIEKLRSILSEQHKDVLIRILTDRACQSEDLADYLFSLSTGTSNQLVDALNAIDTAFEDHISFLHDSDEGNVDLQSLTRDVVTVIRDHHTAREYTAVISLVKRSISNLQQYMPAIDDWGETSSDEVARLVSELHKYRRLAETAANMPAAELAQALFDRFSQDEWGRWQDDETVHDLEHIGIEGARHLQHLAQTYWTERFGDQESGRFSNEMREMRLLRFMQQIAAITRDTTFLENLYAGNLSRRDNYLDIARLYSFLGDHDIAIGWAERGVAAFDGVCCSQLKDFLFDEYACTGRAQEAIKVLFEKFTNGFEIASYNQLKAFVLQNDQKSWKILRDRCYDVMLALISSGERPPGLVIYDARERLVKMRMSDGSHDLAWGEAKRFGCSPQVKLDLAQNAWRGDPASAYAHLSEEVESILETRAVKAYDFAVQLLQKMKEIAEFTKTPERFDVYLRSLTMRHRLKTRFLKQLKIRGVVESADLV